MKLEIIGFNFESCVAAKEAGADRIELCDSPLEGGTTPSYGFMKAARKSLPIDLYVMIRPRGGDFVYSDEEFKIMMADIEVCKQLGCDGIVTGILNKDGSVDTKRTSLLVDHAYPLGVTFHRAFDRTRDVFQSLKVVIETGCERILTSGLQPKAIDGIHLIRQLISEAYDKIVIMPGSGINSENIIHIAESTGAVEFHSSASIVKTSSMEYKNAAMNDHPDYISVNGKEVENMADLLKNFNNSIRHES